MSEVFLKIVNISISAGWLVLAVLVLRLILKKAPKWVNVLLWGIVAVRLICPFSIESALSLIPSAETIPLNIGMDTTPTIHSGISSINSAINPMLGQANIPAPGASINPLQMTIAIYASIWGLGALAMLIYTSISYLVLRGKLRTAVILRDNLFQCETVRFPFVLGILKPRIYLPYAMDGEKQIHVIFCCAAMVQHGIRLVDWIFRRISNCSTFRPTHRK
jgi:beta-lactamase regulating signal transducer with metallopeptidase domain